MRSGLSGRPQSWSQPYFLKGFYLFVLTWTSFKIFIEFVTMLLLYCFGFLATRRGGC